MNSKINADIKSIKFIFNRNKPYLLSSSIIFACIILFFQFIIPQFKTMLSAQKELREASLRLEILKENLNILTNTDENSLDQQIKLLNQTLPLSKDFAAMLSSIYYASSKTGVGLGSFSLRVGDLSKSEKNDKFPIISLSVPVNSDVAGVNSFVATISKTLPLSEITLIKIGDQTSTINLSFYYKPLGGYSDNTGARINSISQKGLALINKLKGFDNGFSDAMPIATSSSFIIK